MGQVRPFLLQFLEMQIPMALGALVCLLLGRLIRASSTFATVYHAGTVLYFIGDIFFLTVPVVVWMVFRDREWRHGLELAVAMLAPVAVIVVIGTLMRFDYLSWLVTAMYPAMSLGLLVYLLHRRRVLDTAQHAVSGAAS